MPHDLGENLDSAIARYGAGDWIDLSMTTNRRPWPVGPLPDHVWRELPSSSTQAGLIQAASGWLGCDPAWLLPLPGAAGAVRLLAQVLDRGRASVIVPGWRRHGDSLRAAGWQLRHVAGTDDMQGDDLAVVVNPNDPDGREWSPGHLRDLAQGVGHLIIDESLADPRPDLSLARDPADNMLILRSFDRFWGLAGLRLGFAIGHPDLLARLAQVAPPWPVNGPALKIAAAAMADHAWADDATVYHSEAGLRLDHLALGAGWAQAGGSHLFRLYDLPDAGAAQDRLARARIWTRLVPGCARWLRMGIPANRGEWDRVIAAFRGLDDTRP